MRRVDRGGPRRPSPAPPWDPRLPRWVGLTILLVLAASSWTLVLRDPNRAPTAGAAAAAVRLSGGVASDPLSSSSPTAAPASTIATSVAAASGGAARSSSTAPARGASGHATTTTGPSGPAAADVEPSTVRASPLGVYGLRIDVNGSVATGDYRVAPGDAPTQELDRIEVSGQEAREVRAFLGGGTSTLASSTLANPACTWSPPLVIAPAGIHRDARWHTAGGCDVEIGGASVRQQRTIDSHVLGAARITVQGHLVDTWMIERFETDTVQAAGVDYLSQTTSSELFAPSLGMAIYTISRSAVPNADGSTSSVVRSMEITSLPAGGVG